MPKVTMLTKAQRIELKQPHSPTASYATCPPAPDADVEECGVLG